MEIILIYDGKIINTKCKINIIWNINKYKITIKINIYVIIIIKRNKIRIYYII